MAYTCDAEMEVIHGDLKINMETSVSVVLPNFFN